MDYLELTNEEERRYEESARYHGKRILATGLIRLLQRSGAERVQEEIESLLIPKTAQAFQVETDQEKLMEQIMSLHPEDFLSGEEIKDS